MNQPKPATFDECLRYVRENLTWSQADEVVKKMLRMHPNLFAEAALTPSLRNQPCGIFQMNSTKMDPSYAGTVGRVFQHHTACDSGELVDMMHGAWVLMSVRHVATIRERVVQYNGSFNEIDYDSLRRNDDVACG